MNRVFISLILVSSIFVDAAPYSLEISITEQRLYLLSNNSLVKSYPISSSAYGEGQIENSLKTPLGIHKIKQKIGTNVEKYNFFTSRQHIPEKAEIIHDAVDTKDDYITSRILWLEGTEDGFNKGGQVDSFRRYIYILVIYEYGLIGQKSSHECIRMLKFDVMEIFELVSI